jgi:hypothetical protein
MALSVGVWAGSAANFIGSCDKEDDSSSCSVGRLMRLTRELDSCDNGTRLPHGVWLHERDSLMDPCAALAVLEGTGRTCARGDRCPLSIVSLFQTFWAESDLMILARTNNITSVMPWILRDCSALYLFWHAVTRKKCHVKPAYLVWHQACCLPGTGRQAGSHKIPTRWILTSWDQICLPQPECRVNFAWPGIQSKQERRGYMLVICQEKNRLHGSPLTDSPALERQTWNTGNIGTSLITPQQYHRKHQAVARFVQTIKSHVHSGFKCIAYKVHHNSQATILILFCHMTISSNVFWTNFTCKMLYEFQRILRPSPLRMYKRYSPPWWCVKMAVIITSRKSSKALLFRISDSSLHMTRWLSFTAWL